MINKKMKANQLRLWRKNTSNFHLNASVNVDDWGGVLLQGELGEHIFLLVCLSASLGLCPHALQWEKGGQKKKIAHENV